MNGSTKDRERFPFAEELPTLSALTGVDLRDDQSGIGMGLAATESSRRSP
jgi:hypothetical protein